MTGTQGTKIETKKNQEAYILTYIKGDIRSKNCQSKRGERYQNYIQTHKSKTN